MKRIFFILVLIATVGSVSSQSKQLKNEALLTSQKWTCLDVSRKKLEKMEFKLEVGNILRFNIDKKYQFENNDYDYAAGTWKLDGKNLYFFAVDPKGTNTKITTQYKVTKMKEGQLILKRVTRPGGKLTFK